MGQEWKWHQLLELRLASYFEVVKQPLSVGALNSGPWVPAKDYDSESLKPARLQLSPGTILLLDETAMEPGTLQAQGSLFERCLVCVSVCLSVLCLTLDGPIEGLENLAALKQVMRTQELHYDFKYHKVPFHTDLSVLCLSEGRSLLQVPFLPLLYLMSNCGCFLDGVARQTGPKRSWPRAQELG